MIGCDIEDCQYTYNKSEQLDRVQVLELKIRDMEKRIKCLEKIVHTSGMLNNNFNNLFVNENSMINDDEILHKSIFIKILIGLIMFSKFAITID